MRPRQLLFPAEDAFATRPGESMELAWHQPFDRRGGCRTERRPAPESLAPTTAERASIFQVTASTDGAPALPESERKISVLSRFNGSSPAGERLPASLYFMTPRSKRKAPRELIRSGAASFLGNVRRRPSCGRPRRQNRARPLKTGLFGAAISSIPAGFSEPNGSCTPGLIVPHEERVRESMVCLAIFSPSDGPTASIAICWAH